MVEFTDAHPAVGRTEEVALDVGIGLLDVVAVVMERMAEPADVVVGVVAHLMAFVQNLLIEIGVLPDIVAHHEEGGLDAKLAQRLENERGRLRDGTVVERQIDRTFVTVHSPVGSWVEPAQVDGWLLNNHGLISFFVQNPRFPPLFWKSPTAAPISDSSWSAHFLSTPSAICRSCCMR